MAAPGVRLFGTYKPMYTYTLYHHTKNMVISLKSIDIIIYCLNFEIHNKYKVNVYQCLKITTCLSTTMNEVNIFCKQKHVYRLLLIHKEIIASGVLTLPDKQILL